MKTYLIDTDILIDFLKGNQKARDFLSLNKHLVISYINAGEILQGARDKVEQAKIIKFINLFELDFGNPKIIRDALYLLKKYNLKNKLGFNDTLIASTCLNHNHILVTKNIKHFNEIEGLKVFNPLN